MEAIAHENENAAHPEATKAGSRQMSLSDIEVAAQKCRENKPIGAGGLLDYLPEGAALTSQKLALRKLKSGGAAS